MKSRKESLIPKPCHMQWENLTLDGAGKNKRHCDQCDTHVHDLTGMTNEEITELREAHGGNLCGMISAEEPKAPAKTKHNSLLLGTSIASLALASCADQTSKCPPMMGVIAEPPKTIDEPKPFPVDQDKISTEPVRRPPIFIGKVAAPRKPQG